MKETRFFGSWKISFWVIIALLHSGVQAALLSYQKVPALQWDFTPLNEVLDGASGQWYLKENVAGTSKMFFANKGAFNAGGFMAPVRLWNGNIFEGSEVNIITADPSLNVGN